jgi:hypothetical protein
MSGLQCAGIFGEIGEKFPLLTIAPPGADGARAGIVCFGSRATRTSTFAHAARPNPLFGIRTFPADVSFPEVLYFSPVFMFICSISPETR